MTILIHDGRNTKITTSSGFVFCLVGNFNGRGILPWHEVMDMPQCIKWIGGGTHCTTISG